MTDNNDRMDVVDKKQIDQYYREEKEKIQEQEAEKSQLMDKSIGGKDALRPSDKFIEDNLGKVRSKAEITQEAGERAEKRFNAWKAEQDKSANAKDAEELKRVNAQEQKPEAPKKARLRDVFRAEKQNKRGRSV